MKFKLQLAIIFCILFTASPYAQLTYTSNDQTHLWGDIEIKDLKKEPFADWYNDSQAEISPILPPSLYSELSNVTVKIFLGTWCGDTQNFLPKFIKIWEEAGLSANQLEMIALRGGELYKQGPEHEELAYDIHRVPTFVFERDGKEIGRIVEHPVTDLETDIAQIGAGIPSTPSYASVAELQSLFRNNSIDSMNSQYITIARSLFGNVSYVGELTTYAKKLHYDGEVAKAEYVYRMNTTLFKYHPYSHYRLGIFNFDCDETEKAKEHLLKCESIAPDYMDTKEYLEKISAKEASKEKQ